MLIRSMSSLIQDGLPSSFRYISVIINISVVMNISVIMHFRNTADFRDNANIPGNSYFPDNAYVCGIAYFRDNARNHSEKLRMLLQPFRHDRGTFLYWSCVK